MRLQICGKMVEVDGWDQLTTYGRMAAMMVIVKIDKVLREEKPVPANRNETGSNKIIQLPTSVPRKAVTGKEEAR